MNLTKLRRAARCSGAGNCPALYRTDDGGYVVQGVKLDADTRAHLTGVGDDEDAVYVPADVLDALRPDVLGVEVAAPPAGQATSDPFALPTQ